VRLRWLDAQIRANAFPNGESMATALGVSRRTAFEDCALLRDQLMAPVAFDAERRGWYYTEPAFPVPATFLTAAAAAAVRHAITVAREYLDAAEAAQLEAVVIHLAAHVPDALPRGRESAGGALHATPRLGTPSAAGDLLAACDVAIARRRKLRLRYHGAHRDADTDRVVRPYHLHNELGEWYLLAHCESRDGVRTFALARVTEWEPAGDDASFTRPKGFNPVAEIGRGFGIRHSEALVEVVIRFSAYQARWTRERRYHESQTLLELPDGGVEMALRVAGTAEVKRWVLGFGPEAEVLAPEELRKEIAADLERMRERYEHAVVMSGTGGAL
jgi:predicted DNA-binding transcriptional regulator YafY